MNVSENPRLPESSSPNHHRVDAEAFKCHAGLLCRCDVAVAYNGDMNTRIALNFTNQSPVGLTRVHLCSRASVYGKGADAAVLKLFGKGSDDEVIVVPSQPCLGRYGRAHRLYHLSCNVKHQRYVLQQARSGALSGHLLDGTAEVEVDDVGPELLNYSGCLYHRVDTLAVNLYAYRAFCVVDYHLFKCRRYGTNDGVGGHKLGIYHCRAVAFT